MSNREKPIGIFDSGVGGLTVLKEIIKELPEENTVYLGDTARVPYGIRSNEIVTRYSFESAKFLMSKKIKIIVVACNTSSSVSLPFLIKKFHVPVLGVIEPGARAAVAMSKTKKISVIGTETTIKSNSYKNAILAIDSSAEVTGIACPLFVPLVEEGWLNGNIVKLTAKKYLSPLKKSKIDVLILGCTHYPLIKDIIADVVNPVRNRISIGVKISLIDSAVETAKDVRRILENMKMLRRKHGKPVREFFVTDSPEKFAVTGGNFLGHPISNISRINIDSL